MAHQSAITAETKELTRFFISRHCDMAEYNTFKAPRDSRSFLGGPAALMVVAGLDSCRAEAEEPFEEGAEFGDHVLFFSSVAGRGETGDWRLDLSDRRAGGGYLAVPEGRLHEGADFFRPLVLILDDGLQLGFPLGCAVGDWLSGALAT